ncbi:hypothetical protein [Mannheimia haemolytica]|uniref:hypothetical protein n=1 Tax=Mannheimia haemolytica TaxID=75985 RepID=UPI001EFF198F|nr:hypothetical protein [Mannheimia haemolytica]
MKHELNLAGITALMNEPIKATLSFLDFPHIRIERLHHDNGRPFLSVCFLLTLKIISILKWQGLRAF